MGVVQSYPRHLLQIHQLGECPLRPQLESVERRLTQKYELLQQQLLECLEQQKKKHEELQQQLIHQEKKHDQDKKELQQQLAQQEKKQEEDKEELQEQLIQREEEVEELREQLAQQEREHKEDKVKLQLQLSLIQQLTGTNNALTLHLVGSIGPCGVSAKISLVKIKVLMNNSDVTTPTMIIPLRDEISLVTSLPRPLAKGSLVRQLTFLCPGVNAKVYPIASANITGNFCFVSTMLL